MPTINDIFDFDIQYLCNSAKELGGTIRDIACDSGLFSAVKYFEIRLENIGDGKILSVDDVNKVEDNGSYTLWSEDEFFLGGEKNEGWLCYNEYGPELVKPDIFAVKQAMNTYYAEWIIRNTIDPHFRIEQIDFADEGIFDHMAELLMQTLPKKWFMAFYHNEIPTSYKVLGYQICFLKYHYPKVYEEVWAEAYLPPHLEDDLIFEEHGNGVMGIAITEAACTASYVDHLNPNEIKPIFTEHYVKELTLSERMNFTGTGDFLNAGIACSKLGIAFSNMKTSHETTRDTHIERINYCLLLDPPNPYEINQHHKALLTQHESPMNTCTETIAYETLELSKANCHEIVSTAGELAHIIPPTKVINPLNAIGHYYSHNPKTALKRGDTALVFYMDESQCMVGIMTASSDNIYSGDYSPYNKNIVKMFDDMIYEEMIKLIKPKLEIFNVHTSADNERLLQDQIINIKKQFMRNDKATIVFNNGWLNLSEKLPVSVFEKCLTELLLYCGDLLEDLNTEDGDDILWNLEEIEKIYLAGSMTDFPALWKLLEEEGYLGGSKEVVICGDLTHVVSSGLTLIS